MSRRFDNHTVIVTGGGGNVLRATCDLAICPEKAVFNCDTAHQGGIAGMGLHALKP